MSTDRPDIVKQRLPVSEFIELLVGKLDDLTSHSFTAKTQGEYVKKIKEDLKHGEFVVLGDFAENHKFVIQDEVQSHYWNKKSCTLHPVMIYYRSRQNNLIQSASIVYESDDLKHDYYFVYKVLEQVVSYIQANLETQIKKITYVSDGCPNQYKNVYHFQTVCHHDEVDFQVPCEWVFFATSHGKSPCDGLGGTTKRLTTRASLQRPIENQITSAKEMYEFCVSEIKGIVFTFIDKEEMNLLRQEGSFLSKRFNPRDFILYPGDTILPSLYSYVKS